MLVLITGATSGFGRAIAKTMAQLGYDLIITGRRTSLLDSLEEEIKQKHHVEVLKLSFDVRELSAVESAVASLSGKWRAVDVLVNNAGLALGLSGIQNGDIAQWEQMIDTNVKGLLYMSRCIAPLMIERKSGHIINIGSVAGKEVYANGNVYCATKHAVDAISKAMRIDMLRYGIKVSQICPGAAQTEFSMVRFGGDQVAADNVYKGYQPLTGEDIADIVKYLVTLPKHVCINDLVVTCTAQANASNFYKE